MFGTNNIVFYENENGKILRHDNISEQTDIIPELTVLLKQVRSLHVSGGVASWCRKIKKVHFFERMEDVENQQEK